MTLHYHLTFISSRLFNKKLKFNNIFSGSSQDMSVSSRIIVTDGLQHEVIASFGVGFISLKVSDVMHLVSKSIKLQRKHASC